MKKLIPVIICTALLAGCMTSVTTPSGAKYMNVGFNKSFGELEVVGGTNGTYTAKIKGYKSDNQQLLEAFNEVLKRVPPIVP